MVTNTLHSTYIKKKKKKRDSVICFHMFVIQMWKKDKIEVEMCHQDFSYYLSSRETVVEEALTSLK